MIFESMEPPAEVTFCAQHYKPSHSQANTTVSSNPPQSGTTTQTYGGDVFAENGGACGDQTSLEDIAWYCHNSGGAVHSVQEKLPNPWGLYDTLGNVDNWFYRLSAGADDF